MDVISRQAAIDALARIGSLDTDADREFAKSVFVALPSAQPEVIKDIKYYCDEINDTCGCLPYDAHRYVQEMLTEILEAVEKAQPEQRWIPCSERLPEKTWAYLITHQGCLHTDMMIFVDGEFWWFNENAEWEKWDKPIIAWRELPEPWKGEEKDEK